MASLLRNTTSTASKPGELSNDVQLANGPDDSISGLAWSPVAKHLAVASWDRKVRIYDITQKRSGEGRALFEFEGPVLSCSWSQV